jgi:hypothetical protein
MPDGLLTAITRTGRIDLLTVPPHASEMAARTAMEQAAQAGNRTHAPDLVAAATGAITTDAVPGRPAASTTTDSIPPARTPDSMQLSTWDWEGTLDRT